MRYVHYNNCSLHRVDPPDDEQQVCSKHVEAYYSNKLIENSGSCLFILHVYITMHGQQNFIIHYLAAHQITSYFTDLCNIRVTYINIILQSLSTFLIIRQDLDREKQICNIFGIGNNTNVF
jgi:hypothetical protein